jgi:hypothetical protein
MKKINIKVEMNINSITRDYTNNNFSIYEGFNRSSVELQFNGHSCAGSINYQNWLEMKILSILLSNDELLCIVLLSKDIQNERIIYLD